MNSPRTNLSRAPMPPAVHSPAALSPAALSPAAPSRALLTSASPRVARLVASLLAASLLLAAPLGCSSDGGTFVADASGGSDAGEVADVARDTALPPTDATVCDDEGRLALGRTAGLFVGACGVASRALVLDTDLGLHITVATGAAVTVALRAADGADDPVVFEASADAATPNLQAFAPAGTWRVEVTGPVDTSVALTVDDACAAEPIPLDGGVELAGVLAPGDCLAPAATDRYVVSRRAPIRTLVEVLDAPFDARLSIVDDAGVVLAEGGATLDTVVPPGTWTVQVTGGEGAYRIVATAVDPCTPRALDYPARVAGVLDADDCADTDRLRTQRFTVDTEGLVLTRAEVVVTAPGITPAEITQDLTNNGITSRFVRHTATNGDAAAVALIGVLDPGAHAWSVGRLYDGAAPAVGAGDPWVATIGPVPEPHCPQHLDMRPVIDTTDVRRGLTAWDCVIEGGRPAVYIQSVTFTESTFYQTSVFIERSGTAQLQLVAPDGRVLDSGLAIGGQLGQVAASVGAGTYWLVVRLESPDDPFTLAF